MSISSTAPSQTQTPCPLDVQIQNHKNTAEPLPLTPQILSSPQLRLTRGPLWARLPPLRTLAPFSSHSQPQPPLPPSGSAAANDPSLPQVSLPDRVSTTRVLLQDTQACIQKLSARIDAIVTRNEHTSKEIEMARTALETSSERCLAQISQTVLDCRTPIIERFESQCSTLEKMQEMLNNNSTRLEAVYKLYDAQSSLLSSLLQTSQSQSSLLNTLQHQQTNITQSTLPLEPLLQAMPLRIDNMTHSVRTAVEDVFSHAIPALLERTLARIQAQNTSLLAPNALPDQPVRQQQHLCAHIASAPSPVILTACSPTVVGSGGPPSTPLIDKINSATDSTATAPSVYTAYVPTAGIIADRSNVSQKRKARTQSTRTSTAPPQNTRNPSAETIPSAEADVDRPLKRTRTDMHIATSNDAVQQTTTPHVDSSEIAQPKPMPTTSKRPPLSQPKPKTTAKSNSKVRIIATSSSDKRPKARNPPDLIAGPASRTRSVYNFAIEAGIPIDLDDSITSTQATALICPEVMTDRAQSPSPSPHRPSVFVDHTDTDADGGEGDGEGSTSISSEALRRYSVSVPKSFNQPDNASLSESEADEATVMVPVDVRYSEIAASSDAVLEKAISSDSSTNLKTSDANSDSKTKAKAKAKSKSKSKTSATPNPKSEPEPSKSATTTKTKTKNSKKTNAKNNIDTKTKTNTTNVTAAARSLMQIMASPSQSQHRGTGTGMGTADSDSNRGATSDENAATSTSAFDAALLHISKDIDYLHDPDLIGHSQSQSQSQSRSRSRTTTASDSDSDCCGHDYGHGDSSVASVASTWNRNRNRVQNQNRTRTRHHGNGNRNRKGNGSDRRFGSIVQTNINANNANANTLPSHSQIEISDSEFDHFFPELADF